MKVLTVYKFSPLNVENTVRVLQSALEVAHIEVVSRDIISFFIINFDESDFLNESEIAFLQEHFDGYYSIENGVATEIYSGIKGTIQPYITVLAQMRERYKEKMNSASS